MRRDRDGSELPDDDDAIDPPVATQPAAPRLTRREAIAEIRRALHLDDERGGAT